MSLENKYTINFMTFASGEYYLDCSVPFIFFSLLSEKRAHVELIVRDVNWFNNKYQRELSAISQYNDNFLIRQPTVKCSGDNSLRFFETPTVDSKYTYITDVDVLNLDQCVSLYEEFWPRGLCFNNILRPTSRVKLSGIHMCKTREFYSKEYTDILRTTDKTNNDEEILGQMCQAVHGLPPKEHNFRPILGVHFSPNRGPGKRLPLRVISKYKNMFINVAEQYSELFKFDIFKNLLTMLHEMEVMPTPKNWPKPI